MNTDSKNRMMDLLGRGFRKDSELLKELDTELEQTLQKARNLEPPGVSIPGWTAIWNERWRKVDEIMQRIQALAKEMDRSIELSDSLGLGTALDSWNNLRTEDVRLAGALGILNDQAISVNAANRQDWSHVAHTLQSHLATIHACAQALRFKLELLNPRLPSRAVSTVPRIEQAPAPLNDAAGAPATAQQELVNTAAMELGREQHVVLDFMDDLKTMFLWFESPEERVLKQQPCAPTPP